jgi:hypothetical protein
MKTGKHENKEMAKRKLKTKKSGGEEGFEEGEWKNTGEDKEKTEKKGGEKE